jgi:diguanylate cyclase (GGDEF)-like protein
MVVRNAVNDVENQTLLKYLVVFTFLYLSVITYGECSGQKELARFGQKKVLVLHAYHQGFHWTDRIMAGIQSGFRQTDQVELFVNYMDTKRYSEPGYFRMLKDLYVEKYKHVKFDVIISSDDHALDFLLAYRDEIFPNVPVVFSGLNAFPENRLQGQSNYTGVYESYDVLGTLELMMSLHPKTTTIAAITDDTRSGHIFKNLIEQASSKIGKNVDIQSWHNLSLNEIEYSLAKLPENALVLWAIYLRTPSGASLSSEASLGFISQASRFPTFCLWDVVGQGVVGGKITSPNFQGESAAKIALRIINGEPANNIAIEGSPLVNIFDYNAMQRFKLDVSQLPENSIVLNEPISFYEVYEKYIWIYAAITLLLIFTVLFLIILIVLKKKRDIYQGLAMRDQLTGVYNRHYLFEMATQKLNEAHRHQYATTLLVLDLDNFKLVNDQYGHSTGDKVLNAFAQLLKTFHRSEDIVARIGGEEFVILFAHCDVNKAELIANRIRTAVEDLNPEDVSISVSIGIAGLSRHGESFAELFERADQAVYSSKEQGRNCVVTM